MPRLLVPVLSIVIVGLGGLTSTAAGQQLLPSGITATTEPFTGPQVAAVEDYADQWAGQLIAGQSPTAISTARKRLLEPMQRPGATAVFKAQYSARLVTALNPGVASDNVLVRLNVMIVAAAMTDGYGLDLARRAMTDEATAVRYWAAKAAADALAADDDQGVSESRRQAIAEAIIPLVPDEKAGDVREQYFIALAEADTRDSRAALMQAMDNRVTDYVARGLSEDLSAEATGLRRLYRSLLEANLQGRANESEVRRLVQVTAKYLQVIRDAMEGTPLDGAMTAIVQDLVTTAEATLNWGLKVFDGSATRGPALVEPLQQEDKIQFLFNVGEWVDRIVRSPIGLSAEELNIK